MPSGTVRREAADAPWVDATGRRSSRSARLPGPSNGPYPRGNPLSLAMALFLLHARRADGGIHADLFRLELRGQARWRVRPLALATRIAADRHAAGVDPHPHRRSRRMAGAGARNGRES